MTTSNKVTREISEGLGGSGEKLWIVVTEWTRQGDGVVMSAHERFDNKAEAEHWVRCGHNGLDSK